MEQINKNLGEIREQFYKNKKFIGKGVKVPPEFELKGYDDEPLIPRRPAVEQTPEMDPQPATQEPAVEQPTEQTATPVVDPVNSPTEATGAPDPEPPAPPSVQTPAKIPKMLSRLTNNLDGINWNVGPLTRKRRYVTALLDFYEKPGEHRGTHLNTEPVPDEEAEPPTEGPEEPEQQER